jgi:predicted ATPase
MLSHFSVKNYKCLADVSLPLTPIHVLIGQNDTGKTSLLEAIRVAVNTLGSPEDFGKREGLPEAVGDELVWNRSANKEFRFGFITTVEVRQRSELHSWDSGFRFTTVNSTTTWNYGETKINDTVVKPADGNLLNRQGIELLSSQSGRYLAKTFRFNPSVMARPSAGQVPSQYTLDRDGFGLATLIDQIRDYENERFTSLQTTFLQYFPQFTRVRLESVLAWSRTNNDRDQIDHRDAAPGKRVLLSTRDGDIRLQHASDGAVLLLGFLALMYSPKPPNVLLIEEPENGIHPKRLIEVAKLLRQFVEREENAPQIIMTTHSPYLLSEFQPEEVTLMRRQPDGSAKAFPLRDAPHIRERMGDGFYLGELWYNLNEEDLLK